MKTTAPALLLLVVSLATLRIATGALQLTAAAGRRLPATDELITRAAAIADELADFAFAPVPDERLPSLLASLGAQLHREGDCGDACFSVEIGLETASGRSRTRYRGLIRFSGSSIVGMRLVVDQ